VPRGLKLLEFFDETILLTILHVRCLAKD